jgi:hypothetical protein
MSEKNKKRSSEKVNNTPIDSRREFLKRFGLVGAAGAMGTAAIYTGYKFEKKKGKDEYVTVLTDDNKLVKVPKDQVQEVKLDKKALQTREESG